ncbi:MAG: septum site-determining protein MinC [Anaerolineae bacterium]|nr:septum site-determining protein MinC [Anaerolineae bacterium]
MVTEKKQLINIKGVKDGLLITVGEADWPELQAALFTVLEERASFLQGARVALDVGNHILRAVDVGSLRDHFSEKNIALWAILSNSPVTEKNAQAMGLATRIHTPRPERTIRALDTNLPGETAIMVQRTIRSGFKISHNGHVVVIGDVNPGGEIFAGGSVVIWGKLKGMVHAGMEGDEKAVVCAMEMEPMQLRIAGYTLNLPPKRGKPEPEMVYIQDGRVITEAWKSKGK